MLKGRDAKSAPSTDLLVCFPSRAHLTLMPKPICSPARPSEPNKRHPNSHHRRNRSISRLGGGGGGGGGQASPLLWSKTKSMGSEISEPTSPKVTCAGQIKVRPKTTACRSWQSVMEEIEKIHNDKKQRKRFNWAESLGFKKEIMQFLTCLRSIRFDFRCFGSFPGADITTEDEEDEDDDQDEVYQEAHVGLEEKQSDQEEASKTVFSKWFMVLQEDQNNGLPKENREDNARGGDGPSVPPANALLLMRCRSAPAKSWLKESNEGGGDGDGDDCEEEGKEEGACEKEKAKGKGKGKGKGKAEVVIKKGQSLKSLMDEEKRKKENLVVMRYDPDIYEISSDIAKETWIVGSLRDSFSRSRSWKR